MTFKTFSGLVIALMSVFCVFVSVDIIKHTLEPLWIAMTILSGIGFIAGIQYATERTKFGLWLSELFSDKEGE